MASTVNHDTLFIDAAALRSILSYKTLMNHLESTLPTASSAVESPIRHSHQTSPSSSLLLMPSFSVSSSLPYIGVKLVTFHPCNSSIYLPVIHANYTLFSSVTGQTLASIDGSEMTLYRTACISGLASRHLSRQESRILVMVGAGAMAPHLIRAHLSARPSLNKVIIWNRRNEKAVALVEMMEGEFQGVSFESNGCLDEVVRLGDVVSCATNSEVALVMGKELKSGAHLDLVGSFKHSMKECDDEAIRRGRVFIDNEAALIESGELLGAIERGVICRDHIVGNLVELIRGDKVGRKDSSQITIFKSVGSALVDLLCAQLVYETYKNAPPSSI
ncbi:protein SAR DEFICIENT 4 [Apium graveolens]|uniref:protein SAR DEFICIENT 4 n=1 Tax=Apium graveolens TaxID=4045 RepID=UPI003D7BEAE1